LYGKHPVTVSFLIAAMDGSLTTLTILTILTTLTTSTTVSTEGIPVT
jgi:hypothetical protein